MSGKPESKSRLLDKKKTSRKPNIDQLKIKADEFISKFNIIETRDSFLSLFRTLPYVISVFDKNGKYLFFPGTNHKELLFWGSPSKLIGKTLHEVLPEELADYLLKNIRKALKSDKPVDIQFNTTVNKVVHNLFSTINKIDSNTVITITRDAEKSEKAGESGKKSLQLFKLVWENSNEGMRLTDSRGKILMVNKAYCRLVNKKRTELEGKSISVVYGGNFKNDAPDIYKAIFLNTGRDSYNEYQITLWNKKVKWIGISSSFFRFEQEEPYLLSLFNNITERKLNEEKINRAFSLLNSTIESTADGILVVDLEGNITWQNHKFLKMWGITSNKAVLKKESKLLNLIKNKLKEPDRFISRINWLYKFPDAESIDILEFSDGKILERYSVPQKLEDNVIGRVWTFRDITEKKISEEALIESEKRFRSLFEASTEGICIISDKYEECNARLCSLLGYTKEEVIGHSIWEFSPHVQPDGRDSKESALEKIGLAISGIPQYFYWQHKQKDKNLIDTEMSMKSFAIGRRNLVQATVHDITERRRYEKIRNAMYKISEAVNTTEDIQTLYSDIHEVIKSLMAAENFYIALYDEKEEILSFPYFVDEFDHSPVSRRPGGGLTEYVLRSGRDSIITAEEDLRLREQGFVDLIGEPAAVWVGVVLKHEGHIIGVMAVQDYYNKNAYGEVEKQILVFVSEQIALAIDRKRTTEELVNYTRQLQANKDLLEERARELANVNAQLAESERRLKDLNLSKDKLFSIIAHDLKGPFQPLLGLSEILVDEFDSLTPDEKTRFIREINNTLKNQYKLVENLLDWSRLQTGRMVYSPEKINLFETVESNFHVFKAKSKTKNITLVNEVAPNVFVFADVYMLQSIIQNLVSNAVKFTRDGGSVIITAIVEINKIKICVADTGVGIPAHDMDKIFKIDTQHTTLGTDNEKGTGLGLIICKELVEKNGGKIWLESEVNKGTKFFITMPGG